MNLAFLFTEELCIVYSPRSRPASVSYLADSGRTN
jgi:hypothetical protein